jgi:hypothetical protein
MELCVCVCVGVCVCVCVCVECEVWNHLIIFSNSLPTSQKTRRLVTKISLLMPFREIIAPFLENNIQILKTRCEQNAEFILTFYSRRLTLCTTSFNIQKFCVLPTIR